MAKKRNENDLDVDLDQVLETTSDEGQTDGQTDPPVDPMDRLSRSFEQMTEMMGILLQRQAGGDAQATELAKILGPALERMAESNLAGAKLITNEQRRTHRPSNEFPHLRSAFNLRGVLLDDQFPDGHAGLGGADPIKPKLKCLMMLPWLAEWESLTREEVELLNLLQPGTYNIKRIDNSRIRIEVNCEYKADGETPTRLVVNHETAYNNDNHQLWPAITEWCRQALKQHDGDIPQLASAVMSDEEEEALIEAGELCVSQ